jgi:hypothetical protein
MEPNIFEIFCKSTVLLLRRHAQSVLPHFDFFKGPRSRCYGRTAALRLIVQPCDKVYLVFLFFPCNGAPVE